MTGGVELVHQRGITLGRSGDGERPTGVAARALHGNCCARRRDIDPPRTVHMSVLSGLASWHSPLSTPPTRSRYNSAMSLLQAVRAAQLVMHGQGHMIRSSLLTTVGRGGHSSLRGPSRLCHQVLTTTQEP